MGSASNFIEFPFQRLITVATAQ